MVTWKHLEYRETHLRESDRSAEEPGAFWASLIGQQTAHAQKADWLETQPVQDCSCTLSESTQSLPSGYQCHLQGRLPGSSSVNAVLPLSGAGAAASHSVQKSSSPGQSGLPGTGTSRK